MTEVVDAFCQAALPAGASAYFDAGTGFFGATTVENSGSRLRRFGAGPGRAETEALGLVEEEYTWASAAARARVRTGWPKIGGCMDMEYPAVVVELLIAGETVAGGGGVSSMTITWRIRPSASSSWTSEKLTWIVEGRLRLRATGGVGRGRGRGRTEEVVVPVLVLGRGLERAPLMGLCG